MKKALHILLERLIDYAGLFPPAALSMQDAVRNYSRYREGEHAWALGRFVVPLDRVGEVPGEFPLSVLGVDEGKAANADDVERIARELPRELRVARGELPGSSRSGESPRATRNTPRDTAFVEITDLAGIAGGLRVAGGALPGSSGPGESPRATRNTPRDTPFVEITDLALIDEIARHGLRAKIRTGGLVPEALPAVEDVGRFLRACKAAGVAFKATAGLHHPLRSVKALTYEPDAPVGKMHGFLNVFLAAAMLDHADAILAEEDARAFAFEDEGASWRGHRVTTDALATMRRDFAISFGSCSFEEPINDLKELGWL